MINKPLISQNHPRFLRILFKSIFNIEISKTHRTLLTFVFAIASRKHYTSNRSRKYEKKTHTSFFTRIQFNIRKIRRFIRRKTHQNFLERIGVTVKEMSFEICWRLSLSTDESDIRKFQCK